MIENQKRNLSVIVLCGSLWGVAESTLGFLLHWIPQVSPVPNISGAVMFPIGFFFMLAAARMTTKPSAALATATVAAAIKLSSVLIPFVEPGFVVRPIIAILAEGTVVFLFLLVTNFRPSRSLAFKAAIAAVSWRGLFLIASIVFGLRGGLLSKPTASILSFLLLDSAINAIVIVTFLFATDRIRGRVVRLQPALSLAAGCLVFALVIEGVIAAIPM